MINRELIRLKVVQLLYAYYQNEGKSLDVAVKELDFSLQKAYDLYNYLLSILVEVRHTAERHAEVGEARSARMGITIEGALPERMMANNQFLVQLEANKTLAAYREKRPELDGEENLVKKLYTAFMESDVFDMYVKMEDFSYASDRELIRKLYKTYIDGNEDFDSVIESGSLYWNDDKHVVDSFVMKTIKRFKPENGEDQELLPPYNDEEDHDFALSLFKTAVERSEEVRGLIRKNCKNWEFTRLALMDIVLMQLALTEALAFPNIPASVSINEYLNLAKVYSTPRSSGYINGLLDHVIKKLRKQGAIMK